MKSLMFVSFFDPIYSSYVVRINKRIMKGKKTRISSRGAASMLIEFFTDLISDDDFFFRIRCLLVIWKWIAAICCTNEIYNLNYFKMWIDMNVLMSLEQFWKCNITSIGKHCIKWIRKYKYTIMMEELCTISMSYMHEYIYSDIN